MNTYYMSIICVVTSGMYAMEQETEQWIALSHGESPRTRIAISQTLEGAIRIASAFNSLETLNAALQKIKDDKLDCRQESAKQADALERKLNEGVYKYHTQQHRNNIETIISRLREYAAKGE